MELYTLRYVLAVADSGNFSLAAQACHVGQPALSQQIAKLEKELGVALFARNPRGATLTEAGKDFVLPGSQPFAGGLFPSSPIDYLRRRKKSNSCL